MSTVSHISSKKSKKKTQYNDEKLSSGRIEDLISNHIDGDTHDVMSGCNKINDNFHLYRIRGDLGFIIFSINKENKVCTTCSVEDIEESLAKSLMSADNEQFILNSRVRSGAITNWRRKTNKRLFDLPKHVAFKSEDIECFSRLDYDPDYSMDINNIDDNAPIFCEMISRMGNRNAFCARLGSIYFTDAPRKQAVWMWGPTGGGKSMLSDLIKFMCGGTDHVAIMTSSSLSGAHAKESLVGKRVMIVSEAASKVICDDSFKSLTGDDSHYINPKGQAAYNADINILPFFFSNESPRLPDDESLIERVIDCKLEEIKKEDRKDKDKIMNELKKELKYITGYCINMYHASHENGKIKCDQTEEIKQSAIDSNSDYQEAFDRVLLYKPGYATPTEEINKELGKVLREIGLKRHLFVKYVEKRYKTCFSRNYKNVRCAYDIILQNKELPKKYEI